jgi:HK97 family phage portal protein
MIFPELRERFKELLPDSGSPISLNLKGVGFDPVSVAELDFYGKNGYNQIYQILAGGFPSWSGEPVSLTAALNHSVVWACNRLISESIGQLPAILMRQVGKEKNSATDHPMYGAMKNAPNDEVSAQGFREILTSHINLNGNGYAQIIRRSGTGTALQLRPLACEGVLADREKSGQRRLVYIVSEPGLPDKTYTLDPGKPQDILHIRGLGWDGKRGWSVITMARQSVGTAIATEQNVAKFWSHGGRVPSHVEMDGKFKNDEDYKKFRVDLEGIMDQPHKVPIFENGMHFKPTGLNMQDAQALESRLFSVPEICRWFNLSPHLAQDHSRSTFNNIEQLALDFVKFTLAPHMVRWEQDFWRCVLTPEEKSKGYFLKLNANAFLRGDFKTRMDGFASGLQNGHINVDEVRELEDRNPLPDGIGSHYHIQTNMGTMMRDGKILPANDSTISRLDDIGNAA